MDNQIHGDIANSNTVATQFKGTPFWRFIGIVNMFAFDNLSFYNDVENSQWFFITMIKDKLA